MAESYKVFTDLDLGNAVYSAKPEDSIILDGGTYAIIPIKEGVKYIFRNNASAGDIFPNKKISDQKNLIINPSTISINSSDKADNQLPKAKVLITVSSTKTDSNTKDNLNIGSSSINEIEYKALWALNDFIRQYSAITKEPKNKGFSIGEFLDGLEYAVRKTESTNKNISFSNQA